MLTRGFIDRSDTPIEVDGKVYTGNRELGWPVLSPEGDKCIGTMTVKGNPDEAMIVRRRANRESAMVARVYGGDSFPCYGTEMGPGNRIWYRIWDDGVWGYFSSGNATLSEGE